MISFSYQWSHTYIYILTEKGGGGSEDDKLQILNIKKNLFFSPFKIHEYHVHLVKLHLKFKWQTQKKKIMFLVNYNFLIYLGPIAKWLLVRRFFLTDHISGIENGTKLNRKQHQPVAKVFRYASDVSLR